MITVVSATAIWPNAHATAIERTRAALPIASRGLLISQLKPSIPFSGEVAVLDPQWLPRGEWNKVEYSRFMIQGLVDYIDTDFCITVQWDGFGLNRHNWSDKFLNYDYIGAPWPMHMNIGRVGNGGFSLRSKLWLQTACNPLHSPLYQCEAEDDYMCHRHLPFYLSRGCRVAPVHVAMKFSMEYEVDEFPGWEVRKSFGFHGFYHPTTKPFRMPQT